MNIRYWHTDPPPPGQSGSPYRVSGHTSCSCVAGVCSLERPGSSFPLRHAGRGRATGAVCLPWWGVVGWWVNPHHFAPVAGGVMLVCASLKILSKSRHWIAPQVWNNTLRWDTKSMVSCKPVPWLDPALGAMSTVHGMIWINFFTSLWLQDYFPSTSSKNT